MNETEQYRRAVRRLHDTLTEMRVKFDGTPNPQLADDDLHRWVSWLSEAEGIFRIQ